MDEHKELERLTGLLGQLLGSVDVGQIDHLVASLAALVQERIGPAVLGATYGPWSVSTSGLIWLEPGVPFTIHFDPGPALQFLFDPEAGPNDVTFLEEPAQIRLGLQTWPKMVPVVLGQDGGSSQMLVQMHLQAVAYPRESHLLRLDYVILTRHDSHP